MRLYFVLFHIFVLVWSIPDTCALPRGEHNGVYGDGEVEVEDPYYADEYAEIYDPDSVVHHDERYKETETSARTKRRHIDATLADTEQHADALNTINQQGDVDGTQAGTLDEGVGSVLEVVNVGISPSRLTLTATDSNNRVSVQVSFTKPLALEETLECIFYAPNELLLNVYFTEAATVTSDKLFVYTSDLFVPKWLTSNGKHELRFFAVANGLTGVIEYYNNGFGTTFDVKGAIFDHEIPELLGISIPEPPVVLNQSCAVVDGGGNESWRCINANITIEIVEQVSGLATLHGASLVTGSHLQLKNIDGPAIQLVTLHFDDNNIIQPLKGNGRTHVRSSSREAREAREAAVASTTYGVRIQLPLYAAQGRWEIATLWLLDKSGNALKFSTRELETLGFTTTMLISNVNNLTYMAEDLFHYEDMRALENEDDYYNEEDEDDSQYY
eukprot:m.188729 g.188729  ORF g.188729 m.188729 type:complete len:444 (+) comp32357_c0_seq1:413-1744(+)